MDHKKFNDRQIRAVLSLFKDPESVRVLYISAYISGYIRTTAVLDILRRNKVHVEFICGGKTIFRYFLVFFRSVFRMKNYDVVMLAFRAHELVPFFRLITRKPIIFDAFVSLYDTVCLDRKICSPDSLAGRFFKWYDSFLCRISDCVLVDTKAHCDYFKSEFKAEKISYLYLECNESLFRGISAAGTEGKYTVFWYGNCWPLQGVDIILRAASLLRDDAGVVFRLAGPVLKKYKNLVRGLALSNIEFVKYIHYDDLPVEINKADICLGGHFSGVPKAKRVIAGKTFQFLACGKKTIVGDNQANRELFQGRDDVFFVEMNSPHALAELIRMIKAGDCAADKIKGGKTGV